MKRTTEPDLQRLFNLSADRVVAYVPLDNYSREISYQGDEGRSRLIIKPEAVIEALQEAGLSYQYMGEQERIEVGNALSGIYAYDKENLQRVLDKNRDLLIQAEWPTEADKFVFYLSRVTAPANTEIFDFIARCYYKTPKDNIWLQCNSKTTDPAWIAEQREEAAADKADFKRRYPEFKI